MDWFPISIFMKAFKRCLDKVARFLFLEAHIVSHEHSVMERYGDKEFEVLGNIKFSISLPYDTEDCNVHDKYIALKAINNNVFSKVMIVLTTYSFSINIKYQQIIVVHDLDEVSSIVYLHQIPFRKLMITDNARCYSVCDSISVKLLEMYDKDGIEVVSERKPEVVLHFTHTDILNDDCVQRFGVFWNMSAINDEKMRLRALYHYYLSAHRFSRPYFSIHMKIFTHPIYLFLSSDIMLAFVFWSRNLVNAKQLKQSLSSDRECL